MEHPQQPKHTDRPGTDGALVGSTYAAVRDGALILPLRGDEPAPALTQLVHAQVRALVLNPAFPCLGARAAFNQGMYRFGMYAALASDEATTALRDDLLAFVAEQSAMGSAFTTFIASFDGPLPRDEADFERLLWEQLSRLTACDVAAWDTAVSSDPDDPRFSFSFGGRAFFLVGLHPGSSRWARRFAWPTIVFNAHHQFEHLRATGRYVRLQAAIRGRDVALQGSPNPNLAAFGTASEARQYSGRAVEPDWRCPFRAARLDIPPAGGAGLTPTETTTGRESPCV
jgi:uncharacterized protein